MPFYYRRYIAVLKQFDSGVSAFLPYCNNLAEDLIMFWYKKAESKNRGQESSIIKAKKVKEMVKEVKVYFCVKVQQYNCFVKKQDIV